MPEYKKVLIMQPGGKREDLVRRLGPTLDDWVILGYAEKRGGVQYDQAIAVQPTKTLPYDPNRYLIDEIMTRMKPRCEIYRIHDAAIETLVKEVSAAIGQGVHKAKEEPVRDLVDKAADKDMVNSPAHYTGGLADLGIEVIDIANACNLNGNRFSALRYLLRAGYKFPDKEIEDLEKLKKYIDFEIRRIKGEPVSDTLRKKEGIENG